MPKAVDLGLPSGTKWASMNIGANTPEDSGLYFAWGETRGYTSDNRDGKVFDWEYYKWCNGSETSITKYCTSSNNGFIDNKTELDLFDDAAYVNLGKNWRMPSLAQQDELRNTAYCTWTWTIKNGVNGFMVTSKSNGNSIFLPTAGCRISDYGGFDYAGSFGYYWSRSVNTHFNEFAYCIDFKSFSTQVESSGTSRYAGQSVRPVYSPSE